MIPHALFGRTGHTGPRTIFGAAALSSVSQADADRTLEVLLEYGINHIDTAASYGESELRIGPWMAAHRKQFFLATKTGERSYAAARDQIHRSLDRLRVDQLDLIQLHNLVDETEWQQAMGAGGALEAAIEARDAGLVRFIGVTGHGVTVAAQHHRALQQFDFDTVLLPHSYILLQDTQYAADMRALLALCADRNVGVQTIKAITRAPWVERPQGAATWYEPLTRQEDLDAAIHWVLGHDRLFVNTVGDIDLLPAVFDAARRYHHAPDEATMQALLAEQDMQPLFV